MKRAIVSVVAFVAAALCAPAVRADTLGLFRCTREGRAWGSQTKRADTANVRVIRDGKTLAAWWQQFELTAALPTIDWTRRMVLVVENSAALDRVIYRVQLDDAAKPRALEVHLGPGDAPCGGARTPTASRVHLVETARSLLPVRFVVDAMVDGRMYLFGGNVAPEGVESKEVGVVASTAGPPKSLPITTREEAESRVAATWTDAERKRLRRGPLDRLLPRVPHGWTDVSVDFSDGRWLVHYDELHFSVDAATGKVTR